MRRIVWMTVGIWILGSLIGLSWTSGLHEQ
jgi:hypothetical protein